MVKTVEGKGDSVGEHNVVIHYMISFKHLCLVTVSCPLLALMVCFVTAYIFQADEIHEDHCRVYNIIPSISAITGVSPQRYLWRISVAFHIGPRFIIAAVYRAYHISLISDSSDVKLRTDARHWLDVAFWLNVVEISSLCGVTYISNRENYPVHEKLFIIFMVSSLTHMLACIKATKRVALTRNDTGYLQKGLRIKQGLFVVSVMSTVGLVGFFLEHRLLCHDMAFSWFAFCEYVVATANMAFHVTVILDFPTEKLLVAKGLNTVCNKSTAKQWKIK